MTIIILGTNDKVEVPAMGALLGSIAGYIFGQQAPHLLGSANSKGDTAAQGSSNNGLDKPPAVNLPLSTCLPRPRRMRRLRAGESAESNHPHPGRDQTSRSDRTGRAPTPRAGYAKALHRRHRRAGRLRLPPRLRRQRPRGQAGQRRQPLSHRRARDLLQRRQALIMCALFGVATALGASLWRRYREDKLAEQKPGARSTTPPPTP